MRWGAASAALSCAFVCLVSPGLSWGAAPPDRNDPCASAGRDSCGTTGIGFYEQGRYGTRWYGDYRGAVAGQPHTFCIDLRFWYASRSYRYSERPAAALVNRDGTPVPAENQRRMAYALWTYGRSASPSQQAAVMLYVHGQMGDARRGELDAAALGRRVASAYATISRTARRLHGPYRVQTRVAGRLAVGRRASATIRLLSATGQAVPMARLTLGGRGATGLPRQVEADRGGLAAITFTPTGVHPEIRVASSPVAASRPRIFAPTSGAAATNGQRLAAPSSDRVAATIQLSARPGVTTRASAEIVRPGTRVFDRIGVHGLAGTPAQIGVQVFGPFSERAKIRCAGTPYWTGRLRTGGSKLRSPAVRLAKAGFYTFRERVSVPGVPTVVTDCAVASETVLTAPRIVAGRGETYSVTAVATRAAGAPTELRIPSLGIRARVDPAAIDIRHGALGIPADIRVAGWWRDGANAGSTSGTILIAGHVDSARSGAGAFFKLADAHAGQQVRVRTSNRRTFLYRIVSVRSYPKSALPTAVYSRDGPPRLVLVTCGGPFDSASGHYRDNVVVTALPD